MQPAQTAGINAVAINRTHIVIIIIVILLIIIFITILILFLRNYQFFKRRRIRKHRKMSRKLDDFDFK
jgi:heme/copper-type cytochrome/quinol oxidase subunit 2